MRNVLFLLLVIYTINAEAQENTQTLDLPTCINYAIEHNLNLKKQELSQQVLQNNYKQSKYDLLPDLNAMSRFGQSFGQTFSYEQSQFINQQVTSFNVGLSSNVYLFEGFRKMHTTNRRLLELETGKISYEILKNQLILEIVNAYLITLYNQEQLEILVEQLSTTDQQIERTQKLIESGTVAKGDLLALTSQRAEEESQLVGYENQIKVSLLNLSQLMNYDEGVFEIEKPDIENYILTFSDTLSMEGLYSEAIVFLPEIKLVEVQLDISKTGEKIAKSGYYPTLALSAALSSPYNNFAINPQNGSTDYMLLDQLRDRRQAEFGVSLSIPIFNKFRNRTNVANAQVETLTTENEIEKVKQDIYKIIQSAYNDVLASRENYNARKQAVEASEESYRFAEQRFNAGAISATDYNIEKNKLNQVKSRLLQSKYDFIVKTKILDFYRGADIQL